MVTKPYLNNTSCILYELCEQLDFLTLEKTAIDQSLNTELESSDDTSYEYCEQLSFLTLEKTALNQSLNTILESSDESRKDQKLHILDSAHKNNEFFPEDFWIGKINLSNVLSIDTAPKTQDCSLQNYFIKNFKDVLVLLLMILLQIKILCAGICVIIT